MLNEERWGLTIFGFLDRLRTAILPQHDQHAYLVRTRESTAHPRHASPQKTTVNSAKSKNFRTSGDLKSYLKNLEITEIPGQMADPMM